MREAEFSLREGSVETPLGRVAYARAGNGAPLVLLHGNGFSWREFERAIPLLATRYDVIAWDQPGHGRSDAISPDTGIDAYAGALEALIVALGMKHPAVLGSSVGAFIAAHLGAYAPGVAGAIILCEAQLRAPEWWRERWGLVEAMFGAAPLSKEQIAARLLSGADDALVAQWNDDRRKAGSALMMGVMRILSAYDLGDAVAKISAPLLLLYGEKSPTVDNAPVLEARAPNAELGVFERAGHFPALDAPAAFAKRVDQFLQPIVQREAQ